jgi:NDP-sugar pyrophosphorylase family protein
VEPFIVMQADRFFDIDLLPIVERHNSKKSTATVVVHRQKNFQTGPLHSVSGRSFSSQAQEYCTDTGVYVFDPCVLDFVPSRRYFDINNDLIPAIISAGQAVDQVEMRGLYSTLNTFKSYQEIQSAILCKAYQEQAGENSDNMLNSPLIQGRKLMSGVWIGRNSNVHPEARLEPPIVIGNNTYIAKGAEIGPETVVGNNVVIDEGATVIKSTVLDGTYVGRLLSVENRLVKKGMVVDIPSGQTTYIVDNHLLSETFKALDDSIVSSYIDRVIAFGFLLLTFPFILLLGLLVLLVNGKIFEKFSFTHRYPIATGMQEIGETRTIELLRYTTHNGSGKLTWLGRLLERFDMERIPEFWNVLKGDVRIVGVKPLSAEEVAKITEPWQDKRFEIPPGITGLWYVQTEPGCDFNEIIVNDVYYSATRSWSGDLGLILKTVITWFRRFSSKQQN